MKIDWKYKSYKKTNMKKTLFVFGIAMITLVGCKNEEKKQVINAETMDEVVSDVVDEHNSQNSLDWSGVYEGTLPCADCEGIKTVIELKEDNTYTISQTYLKGPVNTEEFKNNGTFSWDEAGLKVILKNGEETSQYKVGENQITMLNANGEMAEGELADFYILKKK